MTTTEETLPLETTLERLNSMKQSELLRVAITDLRNLKKNGIVSRVTGETIPVKTDGGSWITFEENDKGKGYCTVCLAGAVFAQTLGQREDVCSYDFGFTLNNLRVGLYTDENGSDMNHEPTENAAYLTTGVMAPLRTYERFANFLEKRGL